MNLVLLEPADFTDATQQNTRLTGRREEHIRSVCRAEVGSTLRVGVINGTLGTATVTAIGNGHLECSVSLGEPPPPPLPLTLILAMPRPKSLKKVLEYASALGIKKICLIETWRVEKSYWTSPVLKADSLRKHLLLGLEQARDTIVPEVVIKRRFKPFVEDELPVIAKGTMKLVAHPYAVSPCPYHTVKSVTLCIGPEGGFIPYEIEKLKGIGFMPITIGERILRVETAVAAIAGRLY
jgi:16S rRNA (uracil1498-N3)-methyltransferase